MVLPHADVRLYTKRIVTDEEVGAREIEVEIGVGCLDGSMRVPQVRPRGMRGPCLVLIHVTCAFDTRCPVRALVKWLMEFL